MTAALALIPNWLKLVAGAVLAIFVAWSAGYWNGARQERAAAELRGFKKALERNADMEKNNAEFNNLDALGRCLVIARDSGLPDAICD